MNSNFLKLTTILFLLMLAVSCRKDDCFTPPEPVVFEFVDVNNQNILQNGTIDISIITVQENTGNGNYYGVSVRATEDHKVIPERIGHFNGSKNYLVILNLPSQVKTFEFNVQSSAINGECTGYRIDQIGFSNVTATTQPGFYRIVID